jgi:hypothetical protein
VENSSSANKSSVSITYNVPIRVEKYDYGISNKQVRIVRDLGENTAKGLEVMH